MMFLHPCTFRRWKRDIEVYKCSVVAERLLEHRLNLQAWTKVPEAERGQATVDKVVSEGLL